LYGEAFYVDPNNKAKQTADQWRSQGRTADAAQLDKIAAQPRVFWSGDDTPAQAQSYVSGVVGTATSQGKVPILVAYNIPVRDCNSYSAGGAASADAYRTWIRSYAGGIGDRKAIVILEPDAIGDWGCLSADKLAERKSLLDYAITTLKSNPRTYVYVDIGYWNSAADSAGRLQSIGIAKADGFALNTSNFQHTSDMVALGRDISSRIGGKHFIIDTSRNGLGPWTAGTHSGGCAGQFNPPGRALGPKPTTTNLPDPLVDALLWIKFPGDSDGACGGFPRSGTWMPEYALSLAQRAAY
jgi:endoglucanase